MSISRPVTSDLLNDPGRPLLKNKEEKDDKCLGGKMWGAGCIGGHKNTATEQQHCVGGCDPQTPLLTMICLWEDSSS